MPGSQRGFDLQSKRGIEPCQKEIELRFWLHSASQWPEKNAEEIRSATGAEVLAVRADVTDQAQVQDLVRQTLDRFGQIDILVINAGGPPPGDFLDLTVADWEVGIQTDRK